MWLRAVALAFSWELPCRSIRNALQTSRVAEVQVVRISKVTGCMNEIHIRIYIYRFTHTQQRYTISWPHDMQHTKLPRLLGRRAGFKSDSHAGLAIPNCRQDSRSYVLPKMLTTGSRNLRPAQRACESRSWSDEGKIELRVGL